MVGFFQNFVLGGSRMKQDPGQDETPYYIVEIVEMALFQFAKLVILIGQL